MESRSSCLMKMYFNVHLSEIFKTIIPCICIFIALCSSVQTITVVIITIVSRIQQFEESIFQRKKENRSVNSSCQKILYLIKHKK